MYGMEKVKTFYLQEALLRYFYRQNFNFYSPQKNSGAVKKISIVLEIPKLDKDK
jgi:hypothetical protein